jgi:hypothetical protein
MPDKIVLANNGQSNANFTTTLSDPGITVRRAGNAPTISGCPAIAWSVAKKLREATGAEVEILDTSIGGQEIDRYLASDVNHFMWDSLLQVYEEAGSPSITAEVFIQGEADCKENSAEDYIVKVFKMQLQLDAVYGTAFPILASLPVRARNSDMQSRRGDAWSVMRDRLGERYHVVDPIDLFSTDGVHWNEPDRIEIGRRLYESYWNGNSKWAPSPFVFRGITLSGNTPLNLVMSRPEHVTVEAVTNPSRLVVPNAHTACGAIVDVFSMGRCTVTEYVSTANSQSSFGFALENGSNVNKIVLAAGVWELRAMPSRRWRVRSLGQ